MTGDREHCFEIPSAAIAFRLWQRDTLPKLKREAEIMRKNATVERIVDEAFGVAFEPPGTVDSK